MDGFIGEIFYFGAPKDGFKVYPDLGARSNVFSGYYSNTETDWLLIAKKNDEVTRYTYVRYGLLTSVVEGRTGSFFGISIDLINHYFTDLTVFRTQIVEGIWGGILEQKVLLDVQETSGKVAFKSYDLFDVGKYLDGMSTRIREVIADSKYSKYIRPSYEIQNANDNSIYGLHPDSSPVAINEYFRTYGAVKLSPKLPIETKSFAEKQEEQRKQLLEDVESLTSQLRQKEVDIAELSKQKDREIEILKGRLEKLQGLLRPIYDEFSYSTPVNPPSTLRGTQQQRQSIYQSYRTPPTTSEYDTEKSKQQKTRRFNKVQKSILVAGASLFLTVLVIGLFLYLSENEIKDVNNNANIYQPTIRQNPTPIRQNTLTSQTDPISITVDNKGRQLAILRESYFLEQNKGTTISNEAAFRELLTTYLLKSSPEVEEIYGGDKDRLWNTIVSLNPNSKRKIADYIRVRTLYTIENNREQQDILKDLVIFTKPPR